jgi:hypothetical protein
VSKVQIRGGWVKPGLYPQRTTFFQAFNQCAFQQYFVRTPLYLLQRLSL